MKNLTEAIRDMNNPIAQEELNESKGNPKKLADDFDV